MKARKPVRVLAAGMLLLAVSLTGCSAAGQQAAQPANSTSQQQSRDDAAPKVASSPVPLANGHFRVRLPEGWQTRQIADQYYQYNQDSATSVQFLNPDGQLMATLRTGADSRGEEAHPANPEKNLLVDGASLDRTQGPHMSFVAASANPDTALLALSEVSPDQQSQYELIPPVFNYDGGSATFERSIKPDEKLNGVDGDLRGAERVRAYTQTDEYRQLKSLLMSFEQVKKAAVTPPPATGQPAG